MAANYCGDEGISSDRTPEFPQLKWLSLKHAGFPNARWLKEPLTQTEATLSPCAKCAGKAGAKLGCVNGSASSQILALGQGSLHPHPQPPHGPAIWEELLLQQLLEGTRGTGNVLHWLVLVSRIPSEELCALVLPPCKLGLLGSLTADWVVDLSGPEQLPPAISANKRPLSSHVEQRTAVERAMPLLRN